MVHPHLHRCLGGDAQGPRGVRALRQPDEALHAAPAVLGHQIVHRAHGGAAGARGQDRPRGAGDQVRAGAGRIGLGRHEGARCDGHDGRRALPRGLHRPDHRDLWLQLVQRPAAPSTGLPGANQCVRLPQDAQEGRRTWCRFCVPHRAFGGAGLDRVARHGQALGGADERQHLAKAGHRGRCACDGGQRGHAAAGRRPQRHGARSGAVWRDAAPGRQLQRSEDF